MSSLEWYHKRGDLEYAAQTGGGAKTPSSPTPTPKSPSYEAKPSLQLAAFISGSLSGWREEGDSCHISIRVDRANFR